MKILVDENIPRMTVNRLRELGHDVRDIRGSSDQGMADAALWDIAVREGRLLITTDKGFTEYRTTNHNGILIVRLRRPNRLGCLHVLGISARHHVVGLFGVQRLAHAALQLL